MQTVEQKCIELLTNNGMFEDQAKAVFEQTKPQLETDTHRVTWQRPADEYPEPMYLVWLLTLKREALKWIDANCPQAWFRPMFCDDPEAELARLKAEAA